MTPRRDWSKVYRTPEERRHHVIAEGMHRPLPYVLWPVDADGNRIPPPWGDPDNYTDPSKAQTSKDPESD